MGHRLPSIHLFTIVILTLGAGLATVGCDSAEPNGNPGDVCAAALAHCGTPLDIGFVCNDDGGCRVDGAKFTCDGPCELAAGTKLTVDLLHSGVLEHQTDVSFLFPGGAPTTVPFRLQLDGVDGVEADDGLAFSFPDHQGPPEILEVTVSGEPGVKFGVHISLNDDPCTNAAEAKTPACQEVE